MTYTIEETDIERQHLLAQFLEPISLIHKHLYNDEIFFFHKGSGSFKMNDQEFTVSEGSTAFVSRGTWH